MKFRGKEEKTATETREETRELAEALSLFGSAMRHAADRRAARMPGMSAEAPARSFPRVRLVLAPALAVAAAVAVAVPAYSHFHDESAAAAAKPAVVQQQNNEARASMNDTVLMNQIDSDLSQDVPDALQPLAQLGEQAAAKTTNTTTEKENATQE